MTRELTSELTRSLEIGKFFAEFADDCYDIAYDSGFCERILGNPDIDRDAEDPEARTLQLCQQLLLVVGEITEAVEHLRNGHAPEDLFHTGHMGDTHAKPDGVPVELADVIIRTCTLAAMFSIDLGNAIAEKMTYNRTREHKHGKLF